MERGYRPQREILLVPLGKVLVDILEEIAVAVRKTYHFHVRIGRSEEPETGSYSDARRQFDAEQLLTLAAARKRDSLVAVLGVVDADMFAGDKSFTIGMNRPGKGAAVLALARLREEFYKKPSKRELFLRRAVTEAIHHPGLAAGLPPCTQKKCVLLPTSTLWRLDDKGQKLCERCQERMIHALHPERLAAAKAQAAEAKAAEARTEAEAAAETAEAEAESPAQETQVVPEPEAGPSPAAPEDESEAPAEALEPETPPAEETAVHPEHKGPEEPLKADS